MPVLQSSHQSHVHFLLRGLMLSCIHFRGVMTDDATSLFRLMARQSRYHQSPVGLYSVNAVLHPTQRDDGQWPPWRIYSLCRTIGVNRLDLQLQAQRRPSSSQGRRRTMQGVGRWSRVWLRFRSNESLRPVYVVNAVLHPVQGDQYGRCDPCVPIRYVGQVSNRPRPPHPQYRPAPSPRRRRTKQPRHPYSLYRTVLQSSLPPHTRCRPAPSAQGDDGRSNLDTSYIVHPTNRSGLYVAQRRLVPSPRRRWTKRRSGFNTAMSEQGQS